MGISVEVQNLGPLESAQIDLGDLNVLVGENNTGKSFFATVLHCAAASTSAARVPGRRDFDEIPGQFRDFVTQLLRLVNSEGQASQALEYRPDENTTEWLRAISTDLLQTFGRELRRGLAYAYGTTPSELRRKIRAGVAPGSLIRVSNRSSDTDLMWSVMVGFDSDNSDSEDIDSDGVVVEPPNPITWLGEILDGDNVAFATRFLPAERLGSEPVADDITHTCWRLAIAVGRAVLFNGWPTEAIHLPAQRSGIVENSGVLAGVALRQLAGVERLGAAEVRMTGTTADLLALWLQMDGGPSQPMPESEFPRLVESFEQRLGASIELDTDGGGGPNFVAVTPEGRFPLPRASAMLSELAPLLLAAKHRLEWGHCLTIDEPEAHLHPEVQRQIASFLVQLATAGAVVVLTTHSSSFVGQLNNHVRAHALKKLPSLPKGVPTPDIDPATVRALWFSRTQRGCAAEPIAVDRIDGIDQGVFTGTMRALHHETASTVNPLLESPVD
ncbi:AAA family ATPase [Candidatus Poriferisodalis sp.]|uniref:AAA family ATPase n=1 Tax=Candidatus Poriferisodalis sp. TaxID=3101277 RepID=UPI003AF44711